MKALGLGVLGFLLAPPAVLGRGDGTFMAPEAIPATRGGSTACSGDFDRDGRPDLAAAGDGGIQVLTRDPAAAGGWKPGASLSAGHSFSFVLAADFNGDGADDIAATEAWPQSLAKVLLSRGDGTFDPAVAVPGSVGCGSLAVGDVDLNGDLDLVSAIGSPGALTVYWGAGDGTFSLLRSYPVGQFAESPLVLDFDGTGKADLAVMISGVGILLFAGDGNGSFSPLRIRPELGTFGPIAAGDFDGDGRDDLVGPAGVGLSWGDGTFSMVTPFYNRFAIPVDLDGDGRLDLVVEGSYLPSEWPPLAGSLEIYGGNGDGTFAAPAVTGLWVAPVLVKDLDGDGRPDFIVSVFDQPSSSSASLGFLPGSSALPGTGLMLFPSPHPGQANSLQDVAAGDLDGDGAPDLLLDYPADRGIDVYLGPERPGAPPPYTLDPHGTCLNLGAVDLDGDGVLDLVGTNYAYVVVTLLDRKGQRRRSDSYRVDMTPSAAAWGRLVEGPGLDLAVVCRATSKVQVLPGRGDGTFDPPVSFTTIDAPLGLASADLDGDGHADVLVRSKGAIAAHFGEGGGLFGGPVVLLRDPDASLGELEVADVDGDGRLDVVVAGASRLALLRGKGGRAFEARPVPLGFQPTALAVADLDGSGFPDLVLAGAGLYQVEALPNRGGGAFAEPREYVTGFVPTGLRIADLDGDGALDVVAFYLAALVVLQGHPAAELPFLRGDANADGKVGLTDAAALLARLFQGGPGLGGTGLPCDSAADAKDDGRLDLTDALAVLGTLFQGAGPLPPPGPAACGPDPTPDGLGCGRGCP